jgi:hypothetical protein
MKTLSCVMTALLALALSEPLVAQDKFTGTWAIASARLEPWDSGY